MPLLCFTVYFWRRVGIGFDWAGVTRPALLGLATVGLPFLGWDILVRLRTEGESLVLGAMLSVEAVGWWAAALRVVSIPIFVPVLIVTPLMPALSQIVEQPEAFTATPDLMLAIPAEGTRSKAEYWKSGFYRIAQSAEVPICLAFIDKSKREVGFGLVFEPSGDIAADMERVRAFYDGKIGLKHHNFGPVRLREETPDEGAAAG